MIKHLLTRGIGLAPEGVRAIVTHGFLIRIFFTTPARFIPKVVRFVRRYAKVVR